MKRSPSPTPAWFSPASLHHQRRRRTVLLTYAVMTLCIFSLIFLEPSVYLLALKHGPVSPTYYCRALLKSSPLTTSLTNPNPTSIPDNKRANIAHHIPASQLLDSRDVIHLIQNATSQPLSSTPNATFTHRVIHQSWATKDVPSHLYSMSQTWRRDYPDWTYVLWTDADNRRLVETHYPSLLPTYNSLPKEIYRADMVRPLYLHAYGGIYVDLDTDSIRPLQQHFDTLTTYSNPHIPNFGFVARMGPDPDFPHSIPNAFMASSSPGHPFFLSFANEIARRVQSPKQDGPEWSTGPVALWEAVNSWRRGEPGVTLPISSSSSSSPSTTSSELPPTADMSPVTNAYNGTDVIVLPSTSIFGYSWLHAMDEAKCLCSATMETFRRDACQALHPEAWALSYWNHAWEEKSKITFGK